MMTCSNFSNRHARNTPSAQTERTIKGTVNMPAIGGKQPFTLQYLDHSGDRRSVRFYTNEITAISLPGLLDLYGDLEAAVDAVTLGNRSMVSWGEETVVTNTPPASAAAQVETEILVRCIDSTTEAPHSFRIPTADYAAFNWIGNTAILSGAGATAATTALVAAIEQTAPPDDETHTLTVVSIEVVQ